MKRIITLFIIISMFLMPVIFAQETALPDPGITPDSPLYVFDKFFDRLSLTFTFNKEKKAEKALKIAKERLSESIKMIEENKTKEFNESMDEHNKYLSIIESVKANLNSTQIKDIEEKIKIHKEVLEIVKERLEEKGVPTHGIENAIEKSSKVFEKLEEEKEFKKKIEEKKGIKEEIENKTEEIKRGGMSE